MEGHSTTQTPSSSRSRVVTNFIVFLVNLFASIGKALDGFHTSVALHHAAGRGALPQPSVALLYASASAVCNLRACASSPAAIRLYAPKSLNHHFLAQR